MKYVSVSGKIGTNFDRRTNEPTHVFVDLKKELKYHNPIVDEKDVWDDDLDYVKRITGYNPKNVRNDGGGSAWFWIHDIVKHLD